MKIADIVEAKLTPDKDFLAQVEEIIDDSIAEYVDFLKDNNDKDDFDEFEEILNGNNYDELPIEFITDHHPRKDPDEWISAAADWDPKEGKSMQIFLHAKNMENVWGPQTFKKILMRMIGHETIHWNQYDKFAPGVLDTYKSGHMKGVEKKNAGGTDQDWLRSYLRDPHELMAYAHDLADEMRDTDNPEETLRNPEKYIKELPVYQRFRSVFPPNAKQLKQLLKYTADYFKS